MATTKIMQLIPIGGELHGILENNDQVKMSDIPGARLGCSLEMVNGNYEVAINNVDQDCVGSHCPIR